MLHTTRKTPLRHTTSTVKAAFTGRLGRLGRLGLLLCALLCATYLSSLSPAFAEEITPPELDIGSYLLEDFQSGERLAEKNADNRIEPASITKMMTAYVIYQTMESGKLKLDDEVLISEKAWQMKGSRMFVKVGSKVPVDKLLSGLVIQSGNDAAVALAEHIAGTEASFVRRMNETAKEIGMNHTNFENSTGWPDPEHYTTANDIITLAKRLITDFPQHYQRYSEKEYTYDGINQRNRNLLLWKDKTVDGIKTGHTESAGYCLAASAKRNNMRLLTVVLGASSTQERAAYSQQLLEYGFRFFETHKIYGGGSVLTEAKVWKGNTDTIPLGIMDDLYVTIHKDRYKHLKGVMEIDKGIDAPIKRGQVLGKIKILDNNKAVKEVPLFAMQDIQEGGFWDRLSDSFKKFFE
ncbi:MAG TPA: D-alanyl-D-alanine carboxypeptidase [Thiothrix sp.]|nr:D-alanyl-D-alanine carboxypeptidase [Thiothrix sp.]